MFNTDAREDVKNNMTDHVTIQPAASAVPSSDTALGCAYKKGSAAVIDIDSAKAFPSGGMHAPYVKLAKREDAVIYEVSVRDFTISPDSDVEAQPGTVGMDQN